MREETYAAGERTRSKAALFPLAALATVFVLPTYASCGGEFQSPAHFASESFFSAIWISSVFLCAAVLAALTFRALWRGEVDRTTRRLGLASVVGFALAVLGMGVVQALQTPQEWPWLAAGIVATLAAGAVVRCARGSRPWEIWEHLLAAFVAIAVATPSSVILGGELLQGRTGNLGPGAYLYLVALAALLAILGAAVGRLRR